jgi:hypothetical protein
MRITSAGGSLGRAICAVFLGVCMLAAPAVAHAQARVWMYPSAYENGRLLQELFEKPDAWQQTRQRITGIGYADHWLNSQFNDGQLRAWLPQLSRWGLKLGLEVGAVKPHSPTGQQAFDNDHPKWDRFIADGGKIDNIAMDEPYVTTVRNLHLPIQYGVEQTAQFVALVRRAYPGMAVGDIEPYPSFQASEVLQWVDALQARLRQLGVKGLDFLRLDVDWTHFHPGDAKGQMGWQGVRMIEDGCHRRSLPFSLIYWAADYPALYRADRQTEATWTEAILDEAAHYQAAGGRPDEFIVESWLISADKAVPSHAVPDSNPATMSGSVLALESHLLPPH